MIFVDTGPLVARYLLSDPYHERSIAGWEELRSTLLITSNHVLDETFTLLARRAGNEFAAARAEAIYRSQVFRIVQCSREDDMAAVRYFRKFGDQGISFADATSFAVMDQMKIQYAFTFDHHFRVAGYTVFEMKE